MAEGAWHYREAERLAVKAAKDAGARLDKAGIANTIALAQVHATLADAAATAQNIRRNGAVECVDGPAGWERVLDGGAE